MADSLRRNRTLDLKGVGQGAYKMLSAGAPILQSGTGSLTFRGDVVIPRKHVGEFVIAKVKVNAGPGTGTSSKTVSSIINRLMADIENNRMVIDGPALAHACLVSALLVDQYPMLVDPASALTDPAMTNPATDYTGYFKLAQGLPPGIVNFRLDTVALASAFTGITLTGAPTVTVEFIVMAQEAELDDFLREYFILSADAATQVTNYSIENVMHALLVHASASMSGYGINLSNGESRPASVLETDQYLATSRLSTGSQYILPVFVGIPVTVRVNNASAVSFSVIKLQQITYTAGLAADVAEHVQAKKKIYGGK